MVEMTTHNSWLLILDMNNSDVFAFSYDIWYNVIQVSIMK